VAQVVRYGVDALLDLVRPLRRLLEEAAHGLEVLERVTRVPVQVLAVVAPGTRHGIGSTGPTGEMVPDTASPATTVTSIGVTSVRTPWPRSASADAVTWT